MLHSMMGMIGVDLARVGAERVYAKSGLRPKDVDVVEVLIDTCACNR